MRILAVNGSPRKGNTELLLEGALAAAEEHGGVSTDLVRLRNETINYCRGCSRCFLAQEGAMGCRVHRDSMDEILERLIRADGLVLATPVYFGGVTGQMKTFMDRTQPLLRYAPEPLRHGLRNKVGAAIVVGGNRNGGQEAAIQGIHHFFMIHDMVVVGAGPDADPGCYLGAAAFSGADPELDMRVTSAVTNDETGMRAAGIVGRRVAEMITRLCQQPQIDG